MDGGNGGGATTGPHAALEKLEAAVTAAISGAADGEALGALYRERVLPLLDRLRRMEHVIIGTVAVRKNELLRAPQQSREQPARRPPPPPPPPPPADDTAEARDRKARGYDHKFHLINPKGDFECGFADPMKWCEALLAEMEKPKGLVGQWWNQNYDVASNILAGWPELKIERASGEMHPVLLMQSIAERKGVETPRHEQQHA